MLTVDFDRLGVRKGDIALDAGCGFGRHSLEFVSTRRARLQHGHGHGSPAENALFPH